MFFLKMHFHKAYLGSTILLLQSSHGYSCTYERFASLGCGLLDRARNYLVRLPPTNTDGSLTSLRLPQTNSCGHKHQHKNVSTMMTPETQ